MISAIVAALGRARRLTKGGHIKQTRDALCTKFVSVCNAVKKKKKKIQVHVTEKQKKI